MKFDRKGIGFNTWLYFVAFSFTILCLFWLLLNFLIRPYYRNDRLDRLAALRGEISSKLLNSDPKQQDVDDLYRLLINSNVCAYVLNEEGALIYEADSLGENCALKNNLHLNDTVIDLTNMPLQAIELLKNNDLNTTFLSPSSGNEMLLYGQKIAHNLVNYYLFINSPLEPMESALDFIFSQFFIIALILLFVAFMMSFLLANRISAPIIRIKKEATKLIEQDYDVHFPVHSFTEINELSLTLDDAALRLSKIDELRKDLIANISHDIKTPLTMIQAYTEMIRDISGGDAVKRNEHLNVILKETAYLNRLASDMQELSTMQAGYAALNKTNFDLAECVDDVCDMLSALAAEKNIHIHLDIKPVTIYADELKILRVIYNFLNNAIKHTDIGKNIYIRLVVKEELVRLEIKDEGEGISAQDLPYIWDRYYKIDKGFTRNIESTGLGLAISKAILEAHKANYGVESIEGEGSVFWFELNRDYEN